MPRYTDIDLLIDKVEETNWYHINKNGELVVGANSETDVPLYKHSDIKQVLAEAPVADVVPENEVNFLRASRNLHEAEFDEIKAKLELRDATIETLKATVECADSEIERLKRICNSYALQYGTVRDQQKVIDEAKREVAMEIFEEIEREAMISRACEKRGITYSFSLAELKKKYMGGE